MKFWIDAQLPPALAAWLSARYGVEAIALKDLGMRDSTDGEIFSAARQAGIVVVSKDSDFVDLVSRHGTPPQLLWVTCGNVNQPETAIRVRQDFRRCPDCLDKQPADCRNRLSLSP